MILMPERVITILSSYLLVNWHLSEHCAFNSKKSLSTSIMVIVVNFQVEEVFALMAALSFAVSWQFWH